MRGPEGTERIEQVSEVACRGSRSPQAGPAPVKPLLKIRSDAVQPLERLPDYRVVIEHYTFGQHERIRVFRHTGKACFPQPGIDGAQFHPQVREWIGSIPEEVREPLAPGWPLIREPVQNRQRFPPEPEPALPAAEACRPMDVKPQVVCIPLFGSVHVASPFTTASDFAVALTVPLIYWSPCKPVIDPGPGTLSSAYEHSFMDAARSRSYTHLQFIKRPEPTRVRTGARKGGGRHCVPKR